MSDGFIEPVAPGGFHKVKGKSQTKASFAKQVNVNRIVKEYANTGVMDHVNTREPVYGDTTMVQHLSDAVLLVEKADAEFMELPAKVRQAAGQDPVTFLEMLSTADGTQALVDAGLPVEGMSPTPPRAPAPTQDPPTSKPPAPAEGTSPGINPGVHSTSQEPPVG